MPLTVLFVCTANISRSPYLERRSRQLLAELVPADAGLQPVRFGSAGTAGIPSQEMDPHMAAELATRGVDGSDHRSRGLTPALVHRADLVLTATVAHRSRILAEQPAAVSRTFTVAQFATNVDTLDAGLTGAALLADRSAVQVLRRPAGGDLADPYRRGPAAAHASAATIDALLRVIIPRLV
ncbi:MAG: low molecular weight phosphatase family protein [Nostocoides sp.]